MLFGKLDGMPQRILTDNMKNIVTLQNNTSIRKAIHPTIESFSREFNCTFNTCQVQHIENRVNFTYLSVYRVFTVTICGKIKRSP